MSSTSSRRLAGKVALVTGAASGIGLATAQRFVAEGASVYFADRDLEGAERAAAATAAPERASGFAVDIGDEEAVARLFAHVTSRGDRVDVVVANAGIQLFGRDAPIADLDLEVWQRTIGTNLTGTFLTVKHAVRAMAGGPGSIIITGSPTGVVGSASGFTAYSASKAGVHGLARVVAADYASVGVRVNVVIPGYTETALVRPISEDATQRASVVATVPLGRPGTPADVEGIMVFLASDESSYATGALFTVDGGATAI